MGQIDEKYRLFDRTNGDPLMIGTLKELAEFMGDSYEYVFELSKEKTYSPNYRIERFVDSRLYRYVKNFQVHALERFGNTIIRNSHEKRIPKYIDEFKRLGYDVEVEKSYAGTLVVRLKR